jgi:hypothetical protein
MYEPDLNPNPSRCGFIQALAFWQLRETKLFFQCLNPDCTWGFSSGMRQSNSRLSPVGCCDISACGFVVKPSCLKCCMKATITLDSTAVRQSEM